jgi:Helix-turn-helix domain
MQDMGSQSKAASAISPAEELEKQRRKESRAKFLDKIRDSLGSVVHQMALSPTEAALACGRSPTWAYRKIYSGEFRVLNAEATRLMIPRSEIERYLSRAEKYDPQPKAKIGGGKNGNA